MDGSCQWMSFASSSSSSSHGGQDGATWPPPPPKRPAGRIKFKETRHPVYRGVRRRGCAGRWVCEVRVPGTGCKRGQRLWLGTYLSAESAGRGHDAAMLMLRGAPAAAAARVLNFPDSEWLLDVPIMALPAADLSSVRRAVVAAVADFQRREPAANGAAAAVPDIDEAVYGATSSQLARVNNGAMGSGGIFELDDICGETDLDMYYAELAEGLLMEPPPVAGASWQGGDGGADADLWSCY